MRRFIFIAFIGTMLVQNAISWENKKYPSSLEWLFDLKNMQDASEEKNKTTVCETQECKKIAKIMLESMDKSIDPCNDFYEYACGKWLEHNSIPEGMKTWSMFHSMQPKVLKQVKKIFEEGPKDDDLFSVKLAKMWYAACMNTDKLENYGLEPIILTMSRMGGWPIIMEPNEWNEEEYSWQKVDDHYMRLTGRNAFHDVRLIRKNELNESQILVHVLIQILFLISVIVHIRI